MARIFITGSADGLGLMAAKLLVKEGHQVVLHARNSERGKHALDNLPAAEKVLLAELSSIDETKRLADEVNALGSFDAIIHNAGVYQASPNVIFRVNSLAPYILTCLIEKPKRLVYLSSGMHLQGDPTLKGLTGHTPGCSYSDSKLHDVILSMAVSGKWPDVLSNSVNPGWVATKMGGAGAPDNLQEGSETQVWLAVSTDEKAKVSGRYFHHKKEDHYLPQAAEAVVQEKFIDLCRAISGVDLKV